MGRADCVAVWLRLTGFTLGVWLYQKTGSAQQFRAGGFVHGAAEMVLSPLAGVWIDRYNRRRLMGWQTDGARLHAGYRRLFFSGTIQVWHIS